MNFKAYKISFQSSSTTIRVSNVLAWLRNILEAERCLVRCHSNRVCSTVFWHLQARNELGCREDLAAKKNLIRGGIVVAEKLPLQQETVLFSGIHKAQFLSVAAV